MSSGTDLLSGAPKQLWRYSQSLILSALFTLDTSCLHSCYLHQRKIQTSPSYSMRLRSKRYLFFFHLSISRFIYIYIYNKLVLVVCLLYNS
ncbi:hypothetical protein L1049_027866 [Liquidambar formosana]|uniref:Uncharacterized protein n=1 Tax=Liquidambar formosana TaxID=63359 RepID=A0AAP0RHX8_LIQFO